MGTVLEDVPVLPDAGTPGTHLVCSWCGTTALRSSVQPRNTGLWDAGWRWRGAEETPSRFVPRSFVFSCPDCPDVLERYPWDAPYPPVLWAAKRR